MILCRLRLRSQRTHTLHRWTTHRQSARNLPANHSRNLLNLFLEAKMLIVARSLSWWAVIVLIVIPSDLRHGHGYVARPSKWGWTCPIQARRWRSINVNSEIIILNNFKWFCVFNDKLRYNECQFSLKLIMILNLFSTSQWP